MYRVTNEADCVDIYIYDRIGKAKDYWTGDETGVSAEEFVADLEDAGGKPVCIHIDSGGGDVFEGFAMCSAIQRYPGRTTACVDGLAASAASYIAVVCDEVRMNDYAFLMIHCASSYVYGNASYLTDIAARLRNTDTNLAEIYRKRSNLTLEQVLDYMDAETWFTAEQALECGLCTEVVRTEERMAACIETSFADAYRNVPEGVTVGKQPPEEPDGSHPENIIPAYEDAFIVFDGHVYRKEKNNG